MLKPEYSESAERFINRVSRRIEGRVTMARYSTVEGRYIKTSSQTIFQKSEAEAYQLLTASKVSPGLNEMQVQTFLDGLPAYVRKHYEDILGIHKDLTRYSLKGLEKLPNRLRVKKL